MIQSNVKSKPYLPSQAWPLQMLKHFDTSHWICQQALMCETVSVYGAGVLSHIPQTRWQLNLMYKICFRPNATLLQITSSLMSCSNNVTWTSMSSSRELCSMLIWREVTFMLIVITHKVSSLSRLMGWSCFRLLCYSVYKGFHI